MINFSESQALRLEQPGPACDRVLIAEDDAMFRRILQSWLESWGYQVTVAEDGAKAWQILQQISAPHLLILDWIMPNLNGIDLCRMVRERASSPYQYILLVTVKDDKQDLVRGLEAGADDYLSKPFDRDELRARLRTGRRILTLQDEQLKAREKLHLQATHDGLTGTWNRTAILDLLHREYELAARSDSTIGLIMLDVDHFKRVNDTYGHLAGDHVLIEASRRMQEAVRSYDLVGRYGGEEFLVVSPDCDRDQIQLCAERIRSAMAEQPVLALGSRIAITVSAGTAVLAARLTTEKDALAAADTALYRAKSAGRNQVASGEPGIQIQATSHSDPH
jgi:two-component system, cell cycle response regulator